MEAQLHKSATIADVHMQNIPNIYLFCLKMTYQAMEHLFHCDFDIQHDLFLMFLYIGNILTPKTWIIHGSVQACILTATTAPWKLMILKA